MADENVDVQEQQAEENNSGGGGKLVTILVILNTLLILAGGGYFMFIKKDPPPQIINKAMDKKAKDNKKKVEEEDEDTKEFGDSHEYKGVIVNLNEPGGSRMLKISIVFEFKAKKKKLKDALTKREAQIRSTIIMYLSGLSYVQTTGSANKELILKTIKKKVNSVLTEGKVRKVFFKEFVVQ